MESTRAVELLQALAQDTRLAVFRLLVRSGPDGVPAGVVARALDIAPPVLSFHLTCLVRSGLVTSRKDGRRVIYSIVWDVMDTLMGYLVRNCCRGLTDTTTTGSTEP